MAKKTDPDPPQDPTPDALADLDLWFARHIPNSRYSADTGTYNRIHHHLGGLRQALASVIKE